MDKKIRLLRYLPVIIGVVLSLLIALAVYFLRDLFEKPQQTKKQIQQVTIIQPPPPPPPPPPEQKPPEPEVKEEKLEEPEPEPEPEPEDQAEEPPPGEDLGVDAEGGAGSDGFGLVGKKGGAGLIGGGGGNAVIWAGGQFARGVQDELQSLLAGTPARKGSYSVNIRIRLSSDGSVTMGELVNSSGKAEVDEAFRQALPKLRFRLSKALPENMPQTLTIRVTSRI